MERLIRALRDYSKPAEHKWGHGEDLENCDTTMLLEAAATTYLKTAVGLKICGAVRRRRDP